MAIIDRPAPDEPEERPDQLGRHLLKIKAQYPGQWREAFESHNRSHAVRVEGCLIGRGAGRIAGVTNIDGWEARLVERHEGDQAIYVVRVRYTAPKAVVDDKPETGRVDPSKRLATTDAPEAGRRNDAVAAHPAGKGDERVQLPPRDPDDAAQAGLDLAAG